MTSTATADTVLSTVDALGGTDREKSEVSWALAPFLSRTRFEWRILVGRVKCMRVRVVTAV